MKSPLTRRPVVAWALYDWANSAFATTVMAGFFPVFFKQFWSVGVDASVSTFRLGLANGVASFCIAVLAPLLGAIADRSGARGRLLSKAALEEVLGSFDTIIEGNAGKPIYQMSKWWARRRSSVFNHDVCSKFRLHSRRHVSVSDGFVNLHHLPRLRSAGLGHDENG